MTDPARVYALKHAELEAERDRYRAALTAISRRSYEHADPEMRGVILFAEAALGDTNVGDSVERSPAPDGHADRVVPGPCEPSPLWSQA